MLSNDALCRCQSSTFNPELRESVTSRLGLTEAIRTSRSGSRYGRGCNNTALTTLKIAVFAPTPSASVSTATAVKPGFFSNWRKANLRSFIDFGFRFAIFDWSVVGGALAPFARLAWDRHGLRPSDHTGVHCLEGLISTSLSIFASAPSISTCRLQRLPRCWFQFP